MGSVWGSSDPTLKLFLQLYCLLCWKFCVASSRYRSEPVAAGQLRDMSFSMFPRLPGTALSVWGGLSFFFDQKKKGGTPKGTNLTIALPVVFTTRKVFFHDFHNRTVDERRASEGLDGHGLLFLVTGNVTQTVA